VFGNEEYGMAAHLLPLMDDLVHIPMFGTKNSMNVANAAGVVIFQAMLHLDP
jgi:tRNA G18 (ribose-2'-O)-methylase SpoU